MIRQLLNKIGCHLCFIGVHEWEYRGACGRRCTHCFRRQVLLRGLSVDDWFDVPVLAVRLLVCNTTDNYRYGLISAWDHSRSVPLHTLDYFRLSVERVVSNLDPVCFPGEAAYAAMFDIDSVEVPLRELRKELEALAISTDVRLSVLECTAGPGFDIDSLLRSESFDQIWPESSC